VLRVCKIPEKRIAVLIGKSGEIKKTIERKTGTWLNITDIIEIHGEALEVLNAENIVKAIGRGFAPKKAMELLDEEKELYIIEIPEKGVERIRSRLIGTRGKARRIIEKKTNTDISVYGKTVSIIGEHDDVKIARIAVEKIILGAPHKNAYRLMRKVSKTRTSNGKDS
jgi:ribosomal RNA assembly protein